MQQPEGLLHKASYNVDVDSDVSRTDNFALVFDARMYMQRHSIQLSPRGYWGQLRRWCDIMTRVNDKGLEAISKFLLEFELFAKSCQGDDMLAS